MTRAKFFRVVCLIVGLMFAQIAQSLDARAHIFCGKIDELPVSDPEIVALVEGHYGNKELFVRELNRRVHVVRLGPANCGHPTCPYRVVRVADGAVQERFMFNTTGWTLFFISHGGYFEPLKDIIEPIAFETSEGIWLNFYVPRSGNTFAFDAGRKASWITCKQGNDQKSPQ